MRQFKYTTSDGLQGEYIIDEKLSDEEYIFFEGNDDRFNVEESIIEEIDQDDDEERWIWSDDVERYNIIKL